MKELSIYFRDKKVAVGTAQINFLKFASEYWNNVVLGEVEKGKKLIFFLFSYIYLFII